MDSKARKEGKEFKERSDRYTDRAERDDHEHDERDERDIDIDDLDDRDDFRMGGHDIDKDRRMFSRKKSCWFCAKDSAPDWKDSSSYAWLVNEFGKISPGRVSGLCATHQRHATTAIKRGRNMGLISYLSNDTAE